MEIGWSGMAPLARATSGGSWGRRSATVSMVLSALPKGENGEPPLRGATGSPIEASGSRVRNRVPPNPPPFAPASGAMKGLGAIIMPPPIAEASRWPPCG